MKTTIHGAPSFAFMRVELEPNDTIIAESESMASMNSQIDHQVKFNGGFFSGLLKKFFGGESLFVNYFTNRTNKTQHIVLTQSTPGDIREMKLNGNSFCFQPGAYICATPGINLNVKWGGFRLGLAREGFFKLNVTGQGSVWYGAYGSILEKEIDGEYIVDSGHLVGFEPQIKLNLQLAGGLFSSLFSGEGFVLKLSGKGKILIQTRSLNGLVSWLNPRL